MVSPLKKLIFFALINSSGSGKCGPLSYLISQVCVLISLYLFIEIFKIFK